MSEEEKLETCFYIFWPNEQFQGSATAGSYNCRGQKVNACIHLSVPNEQFQGSATAGSYN